jgi:flagellar basal-body rod modification protein FlgD
MLDMDIVNAALTRQYSDPTAAAAAQAANAANAKKTELNQADFLALMITQLKNQDPFKPLDPSQYVGQLAQFSSVSGLAEMNQKLDSLNSALRGNQVLDGAALIGRTVIAPGDSIWLGDADGVESRGTQGLIDVPAGASAVQLIVKDSSGAQVKAQALDPQRGAQAFAWDGTTDSGADAPAGSYQIQVIARVGDQNVSLKTSVAARVSSVALDPASGGLVLSTDPLGDLALSDVERVL